MPRLSLDSPVGRLCLEQQGEVLVALDWDRKGQDETALLRRAAAQLEAYFAGRLTTFDLPLAPAGTAFQQRVYQAMSAIPFGETRTYGELAKGLGSAARAVGGACGSNPLPIIIPCHRVLASGGRLGGYSGSGGVTTKVKLLAIENRELRLS